MTTADKSRGMLFSAPMITALLNTKPGVWPAEPIDPSKPFKSQTRRIVKPQPSSPVRPNCDGLWSDTKDPVTRYFACPHPAGSLIYSKETFGIFRGATIFRADCLNRNGEEDADGERCRRDYDVIWKPSIFMPHVASRMLFEVMDVRVERVQDISDEDALAEGVEPHERNQAMNFPSEQYMILWNKLNDDAGFGWDVNPWTWAYSLKRIK